jgi:hypothetical protein
VTSAAFQLRRGREEFLSVNWLEFFVAATRAARVRLLRELLVRKLNLSRNGLLAFLPIGSVRELSRFPGTQSVLVEHHPSETDPSHAGIHVAPEHEIATAVALANLVEETHSPVPESKSPPPTGTA